ncbi:dirigent protein 23-like [Papaver somniferum]|uniref:dirigent protein 23-like n=1 Tax=Papaver somniferum TaxID=3469 RepID=UPI000E702BAF|nr:dirigent protein 23-like [Papaver somniferum]
MGVVAARVFLLQILFIVAVVSKSISHQIQAQKADWSETVPYQEQFHNKVTRLHFYFHDTVSGKNPTAIPIAQGSTTNQSSTMFGTLRMIDDPLTEGSDPSSKVVGRAQGMYGFSGQDQLSLIAVVSYVFTDEKLKNGSSLSLVSSNPILNPVRELAVVGGTGSFRFASGFAQIKTVFFNLTSGDAIVEYNVTVVHY